MARMAWLLVTLVTLVSVPAAIAEDKIVGAAWEIKFDAKTKEKPTLRIRATPDGKVYEKGSEAIGTWKGNEEKVELEITNFGRFNGTYVLTQIANSRPGRWSGKWTAPDDTKSRVVNVKLLKD